MSNTSLTRKATQEKTIDETLTTLGKDKFQVLTNPTFSSEVDSDLVTANNLVVGEFYEVSVHGYFNRSSTSVGTSNGYAYSTLDIRHDAVILTSQSVSAFRSASGSQQASYAMTYTFQATTTNVILKATYNSGSSNRYINNTMIITNRVNIEETTQYT